VSVEIKRTVNKLHYLCRVVAAPDAGWLPVSVKVLFELRGYVSHLWGQSVVNNFWGLDFHDAGGTLQFTFSAELLC